MVRVPLTSSKTTFSESLWHVGGQEDEEGQKMANRSQWFHCLGHNNGNIRQSLIKSLLSIWKVYILWGVAWQKMCHHYCICYQFYGLSYHWPKSRRLLWEYLPSSILNVTKDNNSPISLLTCHVTLNRMCYSIRLQRIFAVGVGLPCKQTHFMDVFILSLFAINHNIDMNCGSSPPQTCWHFHWNRWSSTNNTIPSIDAVTETGDMDKAVLDTYI